MKLNVANLPGTKKILPSPDRRRFVLFMELWGDIPHPKRLFGQAVESWTKFSASVFSFCCIPLSYSRKSKSLIVSSQEF